MPVSIPHFVPMKVMGSHHLSGVASFAARWHWSVVTVGRMEMIIYMPVEMGGAVEPWAGADEHPVGKPFRAVIAGRSAGIRGNIIVTVGAVRRRADFNGNLSRRFGRMA